MANRKKVSKGFLSFLMVVIGAIGLYLSGSGTEQAAVDVQPKTEIQPKPNANAKNIPMVTQPSEIPVASKPVPINKKTVAHASQSSEKTNTQPMKPQGLFQQGNEEKVTEKETEEKVEEKLETAFENKPPFKGKRISGTVVSIYSGDSFSFRAENGNLTKVRLKDIPQYSSREDLKDKIWRKPIEVEFQGKDKFGNQLAIVFARDANVNEILIAILAQNLSEEMESLEPPVKPAIGFWLNTKSNTRHNPSCTYFGGTTNGRACKHDEGKPCKICGG